MISTLNTHYSAYIFEDTTGRILKENTVLKSELEAKQTDTNFAKNPKAKLDWISNYSFYYEKTQLQYLSSFVS